MLYVNKYCYSRVIDYMVLLGYHVKIKAGYFELIAGKAKGVSERGLVLNHTCCINLIKTCMIA